MKGSGNDEEEWAFVGEWSVEEPYQYKGMDGDKGLVVKNPAAHHAISAKFPKKIDNKGKTLVVQYEVKLQSKFHTIRHSPASLFSTRNVLSRDFFSWFIVANLHGTGFRMY